MTERLAGQARLIGTWGHLLAAGVDEARALALLGEETPEAELQALARAAAQDGVAKALDARGGALESWVVALLAPAPRRGEHLVAAGTLLEKDAGAWSRGRIWAKLELLHRAGAPLGDALSALAREARDHDRASLAEALYAAAKRARTGGDLLEALRAGAGGLSPAERLALEPAKAETLPATLRALEGIGALLRPAAPSGATAGETGAKALTGLANAASAGAAPIRRGLERLLSGVEEALGIGAAEPSPAAREAAREALQSRAAARAEARVQAGAATPPAPPPSHPAPGGAAKTTGPAPAPVASDAPPGESGRRKTIGMDSGPVPKAGFAAVQRDAVPTAGSSPPSRPVDRGLDRSLDRSMDRVDREAWVLGLDAARGKLVLLELHADEPVLSELERDLERLRGTVPGGDRRLLEQLDDLTLRLATWKARPGA